MEERYERCFKQNCDCLPRQLLHKKNLSGNQREFYFEDITMQCLILGLNREPATFQPPHKSYVQTNASVDFLTRGGFIFAETK